MAVARPKTERIDIRTTRATKVTLQRAAGAAAKTVSYFCSMPDLWRRNRRWPIAAASRWTKRSGARFKRRLTAR